VNSTKRLRIFAGPNGSGKSTLIKVVEDSKVNLGIYINADDLNHCLNKDKQLDFNKFELSLDMKDFIESFRKSPLFLKSGGKDLINNLKAEKTILYLANKTEVNDYFTAFLADYLRNKLLGNCNKFTFETVMSHPSKLEFILKAKEQGFKVYLYFISLENPTLNIGRVKTRVDQGGHNVPEEKIRERYQRTMDQLLDAIKLADKSFIFDNSHSEPKLFAISNNEELEIIDTEFVPFWFQTYVLSKLEQSNP